MPAGDLNVKTLFDQAMEIESHEERQVWLERVCADRSDLKEKVEGLLRSYEEAGSFLQKPILGSSTMPKSAQQQRLSAIQF